MRTKKRFKITIDTLVDFRADLRAHGLLKDNEEAAIDETLQMFKDYYRVVVYDETPISMRGKRFKETLERIKYG